MIADINGFTVATNGAGEYALIFQTSEGTVILNINETLLKVMPKAIVEATL